MSRFLRTTTTRWLCGWLLVLTAISLSLCVRPAAAQTQALAWLSSRTGGSLHFEWTIGETWTEENDATDIVGFDVRINDTTVDFMSPTDSTYALYGLLSNTTYQFYINAVFQANSSATALVSNTVAATTTALSRPSTMRQPMLVDVGGGFVRVQVKPPEDAGGMNITSVNVIIQATFGSGSFQMSKNSSATDFAVYGLSGRTQYLVSAYATNEGNLSSIASEFLSITTLEPQLAGPCPAPTVLNVTGGSVALQFSPPLDDGGAEIKGYIVYVSVNGSESFEEIASTIDSASADTVDILRLPGQGSLPLQPLSRYDFKAIAVNLVDMCLYLPTSIDTAGLTTVWTSNASLPEAPTPPYFLSSTGGRIVMELVKPANMRGSTLSGFSVQVNGTVETFLAANQSRTYSLEHLYAESAYTISVSCLTSAGATEWSKPVEMRTGSISRPSPLTNWSVSAISSSSATLQWFLPLDSGGASITDFTVTCFSSAQTTIYTTGDTIFRLTQLISNTAYTVKISATNSAGLTSSSIGKKGLTFETKSPSLPSEPWDISSFSRTGGSIELTWNIPLETGGTKVDALVYNATMVSIISCFDKDAQDPCSHCQIAKPQQNDTIYQLLSNASGCEQNFLSICGDGTSNCCMKKQDIETDSWSECGLLDSKSRFKVIAGTNTSTFEGLNYSTTYFFGVQAINRIGASKLSTIVGFETRNQTVPGFPVKLNQINTTGGSLYIAWDPPHDTGGSPIAGYRVYRDYELLSSQHRILPPYFDCGNLYASTQYVYGVSAMNQLLVEGPMATAVLATGTTSTPVAMNLRLEESTSQSFNVSVIQSCDNGGSMTISYEYKVDQGANASDSSYFACCNFVINALQPDASYNVSVRVTNEFGSSPWTTAQYKTRTGIPSEPSLSLLSANLYSMVLLIADPFPVDEEIEGYEINVYFEGTLIWQDVNECTEEENTNKWTCDRLFIIKNLSPSNSYGVFLRAHGPLGSSPWSNQNYQTSNTSTGHFVFSSSKYYVESGQSATLTIYRVGNTSGSSLIAIGIAEPSNTILNCDCLAFNECQCGIYMASSGIQSQPATLTFLDSEVSQNVVISAWLGDEILWQPLDTVFTLLPDNSSLSFSSKTVLEISPSQQSGFASFVQSRMEVLENSSFVQVNIIRLNGSSGSISFNLDSFDITSVSLKDYVPIQQTIVLQDRQSVVSVWIKLIDDAHYRGTRMFGLRLTPTGNSLSLVTQRVVIFDDDDISNIVPDIPTSLGLTDSSGGELSFSWSPPTSDQVVGYVVRVSKNSSDVSGGFFTMYNLTQTVIVLSNLTSESAYSIEVAAWNSFGLGDFGASLTSSTTSSTSPTNPQNFHATILGRYSVQLIWNESRDSGGLAVEHYVVWIKTNGTDLEEVSQVSAPQTFADVNDLNSSTFYTFYVAAGTSMFPALNTSELANLTLRTANESVPYKPRGVSLYSKPTGGTLSLQVSASNDTELRHVSGYKIYLRSYVNTQDEFEGRFSAVCDEVSSTINNTWGTCVAYKLLANTSYETYATFSNSIGESLPSDRFVFTTNAVVDLPSTPLNFQAFNVTAGNVYLKWDLPIDLGGVSDVIGYIVYMNEDLFSDSYVMVYDGQNSRERTVAVKDLTRGTTYAFSVVVLNTASYCVNLSDQDKTQPLLVTTLSQGTVGAPGQPYLLSRTGGSITFGWSAPDDFAGIPLSGYLIYMVMNDDTRSQVLISDQLPAGVMSYTDYGRKGSTEYSYTVKAANQDGFSAPSPMFTTSTTTYSSPSAVQNLRLQSATGGVINLVWDAPLDAGGQEIMNYQVLRTGLDDIITVSTASLTDTSGLAALSSYQYTIRAYNGFVLGRPTSFAASTNAPTIPDPLVLTSVVPFGGRLEVSWNPPLNTGGLPLTRYVLNLNDPLQMTTVDIFSSNLTSHIFSGLHANKNYSLIGWSINSVGQSTELEFNTSTGPPDLPGVASQPIASRILGGSVVLTVTTASYNGGENVTTFLYQDDTIVHTFTNSSMNITIYGLTALTEYEFHAETKNSRGVTKGSSVNITTGEMSTPGNVSSIYLTEASYDEMTISWPAVMDTGGDTAIRYQVTYTLCEYDETPIDPSEFQIATSNTTNLTSLDPESYYCVSVAAFTQNDLFGNSSSTFVFETEAPSSGTIVAELSEVFIQENASVVSVPVVRVNGSFGNSSYSFSTEDGTALAGSNYIASSGTLVLLTNVKTGLIDISIINDDTYDPDNSFIVFITDDTSGTRTITKVNIQDDGDAGFISFTESNHTTLENRGILQISLRRVGGASPEAVITPFLEHIVGNFDRFALLNKSLVFPVNETRVILFVEIYDDNAFQLVPDEAKVSFIVSEGGSLHGDPSFTYITALDDGDVSLPKECTELQQVSATGGAMLLRWTPPEDKGGNNVDLTYILELGIADLIIGTSQVSTENATIYGLNASTAYAATVRAVNRVGTGPRSSVSLLTTGKYSPPTPPINIALVGSHSSSLLLSWDPPVDTGGSEITGYKIYNASELGSQSLFENVICSQLVLCSINKLSALAQYSIQIQAVSSVAGGGELSQVYTFNTTNPDLPGIPPAPSVFWKSAGAMSVQMFDPVYNGGAPILIYRLFVTNSDGSGFIQIYEGSARNFTLYRIERSTQYTFRYQVNNSVGSSDYSSNTTDTTLAKSLPSAPLNLVMTNRTGGAITLAWDEPLDIGGRAITGYYVVTKIANSSTSEFIGYDGRGIASSMGTVYGLKASSSYIMYAIAFTGMSNCYDNNEWVRSSTIQIDTLDPTPPGTSPVLSLAGYTGGRIDLVWTEPKDTGGILIGGYRLYLVSPANLLILLTNMPANVLASTQTNLTELTTYTYIVIAFNEVGESPQSSMLVGTTSAATPPSAPLNVLQLNYTTGGSITIGWDPPFDTGGEPINEYWLYRDGNLIAEIFSPIMRVYTDIANLKASTSYQYTVRASSTIRMGDDVSSVCFAQTIAATKPQIPSLFKFETSPSTIHVVWSANEDSGGIPVRYYHARLLFGNQTLVRYQGNSTFYTFSGLIAQSPFVFSLVTYNDVGASPEILANFTTKPLSLPGVPPIPLVISVFGGNFTVELVLPVETGGASIISMMLYESKLGYASTVQVSANGSTRFSFLGTSSESDYVVSTSAVNVLGEGARSSVISVRTAPINAPGAILQAPVFNGSFGTTSLFTWIDPVDTGGGQLVRYEVRAVGPSGVGSIYSSAIRQSNVTGLQYDTQYSVSARAINNVGYGVWSPALVMKTAPESAGIFSFVSKTISVLENSTSVQILILRTNGSSGQIRVSYAIPSNIQNTATIGDDFALIERSATTSSSILFAHLETQVSIVVFIINDAVYENPEEYFWINITSVSTGATIGSNSSVQVTILDDGDAGYVSFENPIYSFSESNQTAVIPIIRENGNSSRITLLFTYTDLNAIIDRNYRKATGIFAMGDGVARAELKLTILNNRVYEFPAPDFLVQMQIGTGGAILRRNMTRVIITDDGDASLPGNCSAPVVISTTGGAAQLQLALPIHNGSANGTLTGYAIRVFNATSVNEVNRTAAATVSVGQLTALLTYRVSVAAVNSVGTGNFSVNTTFTTSVPSLPGKITSMAITSATGGRISLVWSPPDDTGGVPITKYRLYKNDSRGIPQVVMTNENGIIGASIYGLNSSSIYTFSVQAGNNVLLPELANGWGDVSDNFYFSSSQPTLPGPLQVYGEKYSNPTGGSVSLSWELPQDTGGVNIVGYNVYARNSSSSFYLALNASSNSKQYGTVALLQANTWYQLFVLAQNNVNPIVLPGTVSIIGGAKIMQTSEDLSSVLVTGSVIMVQTKIFMVGNASKPTKGIIPLFLTHMSASLIGQRASLLGWSTSFVNLSTIDPNIPAAPPAPILVNVTGGAAYLQLSSPDDTGGVQIDDFNIFVNDEQLDVKNASTVDCVDYSINYLQKMSNLTIGKLLPLTIYSVRVQCVNALSECYSSKAFSEFVTFMTNDVSVPGAPSIIIPTGKITGGGMQIRIKDPLDTGGNLITQYQLYYTEMGSSTWKLKYSGPEFQIPIAGLQATTTYDFKATVFNGKFESTNSSNQSSTTSEVSRPGACSPLTLVNSTGGMLNVTWVYPFDNGGSPVTGFKITIVLAVDGSSLSDRPPETLNGTYYVFYRLSSETSYEVKVQAGNEKGWGPSSDPKVFQTNASTVSQGTIAVNLRQLTGGAAAIEFNEPLDLGGTPSENMVYQVYVDSDNTQNISSYVGSRRLSESIHRYLASSSTQTAIVGGLDANNLYSIRIRPVNAVGGGTLSNESSAETSSATVPSQPLNLASSTETGGSITMTWDPPADTGGVALGNYNVYMATNQTGTYTIVCQNIVQTCEIIGLEPNTLYWFYVTVSNSVGVSPSSSIVSVYTDPITPPGHPVNTQILSVGHDSIQIEWDAPKDAGGDKITGYVVTIKDEEQFTSTDFTETQPSATITGLLAGTAYSFSVAAINSVGTKGTSSGSKTFTTSTASGIPSKPIVQCVSQSFITLRWFEYPLATRYRLTRNGTEIFSGAATIFDDSSAVSAEKFYEYALSAEISGVFGADSTGQVVQALQLSQDSSMAVCSSEIGVISMTDYQPSTTFLWKIKPGVAFNQLTLNFSKFDLECDHDSLEIIDAATTIILWKGGCQRTETFLYQAKASVVIRFTSDESWSNTGFVMSYETDGSTESTQIAPPSGSGLCSSHGRAQTDGSCKCSVGFTGEGCSNRIICCTDPKRCYNLICDVDQSQVIVVSNEFGNDIKGTGEMKDASENGASTKAVKTLSRALDISSDDSIIFMYPEMFNDPLDCQLLVEARNVTIRTLKGSYWTTVDCAGSARAWDATQESTISIQGLTIQNCSSDFGGGIRLVDSTLNINDVVFSSAVAIDNGGIIYGERSTITASLVAIKKGSAQVGGALFLLDTQMTLTKSNITLSSGARGGAIAMSGVSTVYGIKANLTKNVATEYGGAIFVQGDAYMEGCSVFLNNATVGGGIVVDSGSLEVVKSLISNCTASTYGGGLVMLGESDAHFRFSNITRNQANMFGGGAYVHADGQLVFESSLVSENIAVSGAGMYLINSTFNVTGVMIEGGSSTEKGGGIAMQSSRVSLNEVVISGNNANAGGGIDLSDSQMICNGQAVVRENKGASAGGIMLSNSSIAGQGLLLISHNQAYEYGGGFAAHKQSSMSDVIVRSCFAADGGGATLEDTHLMLNNVKIENCEARNRGGNIIMNFSTLTASELVIASGNATYGGGIYAIQSTISGDIVVTSSTALKYGGGMFLQESVNISGLLITNSSAQRGGSIHGMQASVNITDTKLTLSSATLRGGGLHAESCNVSLENVLVDHQICLQDGGGIYLSLSTATHRNLTITKSSARNGGGIYLNSSTLAPFQSLDRSYTLQNNASSNGGNIFMVGFSEISALDIFEGFALNGGGLSARGTTGRALNCVFSENTCINFGAGIHVEFGSSFELSSVDIVNNTAGKLGGGVSVDDSVLYHNRLNIVDNFAPNGAGLYASSNVRFISSGSIQVHFERNNPTDSKGVGGAVYIALNSNASLFQLNVLDGTAYRGAGVFVDGGTLQLHASTLSDNNGNYGAGMFLNIGSNVTLVDCDFIANNAYSEGGAIASSGNQSDQSILMINNCSFMSNNANENGGSVAISYTALTVSNALFDGNTVKVTSGGAISAKSSSVLSITDSRFYNNTVISEAASQGSSLFLAGGSIGLITDCFIISNHKSAMARYGGLIYAQDSGTKLTILRTEMNYGQAYNGGCIYSLRATIVIVESFLGNGFGYEFGGGIFADSSVVVINDSTIFNNFAYYDGGGIIMQDDSQLIIDGCLFDLNSADDRGGGIALSAGTGVNSTIMNTQFTRNTNQGLGSTIFVGRKGSINMINCSLSSNGNAATEGGTLYVIDGTVNMENSTFAFNSAQMGGAIELSRSANLTAFNTLFQNNSATDLGGAIYTSVKASVTLSKSEFYGNSAVEGGAIYAIGSSSIVLNDVDSISNAALSFGGAISAAATASLSILASRFTENQAYTGGSISVAANASMSISSSRFEKNAAKDFGGAIYIDTKTHGIGTSILCSSTAFGANIASGGSDIFWVYYPWYAFQCQDCTDLSLQGPARIASSAARVTAGWWPSNVTSGVSLGVTKRLASSNSSNSSLTSSASQSSASPLALQSIEADANLSSPFESKLWPTIVVRDYYGAIASYDNQSMCTGYLVGDEDSSFNFRPTTAVSVSKGYVTLDGAIIYSSSRPLPFTLNVSCDLSDDVQSYFEVQITVQNCNSGYENIDGVCIQCRKGMYSLDGIKCYLCPVGATCEQTGVSGISYGVTIPSRQTGYYLYASRSSYLAESCNNPSSWLSDDPCRLVNQSLMSYRLQNCSASPSFEAFWSRKRVFACLAEKEYYNCDAHRACVNDSSVTAVAFSTASQCDEGYAGVICATCVSGFYKVSSGLCKPCSDPNDPALRRTTLLIAMIPLVLCILAIVLVWFYLRNASENELMSHANAAKKYQIYSSHGRSKALLTAAKFYVTERAQRLVTRARESFQRNQTVYPFQIAPQYIPVPALRAEKFKILLGFFQVFGGFKKLYDVPWPTEVSKLMDILSIADFNLVDTTGIECFYQKNYFANFRLSLVVIIVLLLYTGMLLIWGVVRYRVKLSTLPRHCVFCGLPVFKLIRDKPQTLVRRATMVSMLKMERQSQMERLRRRSFSTRIKAFAASRATNVIDRTRERLATTRFGRAWNRLVRLTRLPASASVHKPTCPTTQQIDRDVLGMVVRSNLRLWRARILLRLNYRTYQNKCIKLLFWILLLFYPELCQRVIGMFYCDEIGPKHFMSLDKSQLCYEGMWLYYLPLTLALCVIWVIGVPLLFWIIIFLKRRSGLDDKLLLLEDPSKAQLKERLMLEMRQDLLDQGRYMDERTIKIQEKDLLVDYLQNARLNEPSMVAQVGFIYHSYNPAFWWFEVWDLFRKLFLNCVIGLLAKAGANRIIAALIVFLMYLSVMLFYQPYKEKSDSALAGVTQIQLFITLFCGLILKMGFLYLDPSVVSMLTYVAFVSNAITLGYALFSIVYEKIDATRKVRRRIREEHRLAIQRHVRKLWRKAYGFAQTEVYLRDSAIRPMPLLVILELARRNAVEINDHRVQLELMASVTGEEEVSNRSQES